MITNSVHKGAIGVSRAGFNPHILVQVEETRDGNVYLGARCSLTVNEAEALIVELREQIDSCRNNPCGTGHNAVRFKNT